MVDVKIIRQGGLVGFTPLTQEARDWFSEKVKSEGWQWLGPTLWVDARFADNLAEGLAGDGMEGSDEQP